MEYNTKDTILKIENLSAGYKDKHGNTKLIIKDISFSEQDITRNDFAATGQTIAFIGRSGRGKSTLFKALTGLLIPETGDVMVADLLGESKLELKKVVEGDVGFVDQKYTIFRHKTVEQVCKYALRKSKLSKAEKSALIDEYLNDWGLSLHRKKYSCELSGGQRQRAAIIEQMLTSKHFMILDEPFSGLDVGNIEKVKESFNKILSSNEYNTIIFSTHDIRLAVELADSIYIVGFPEGTTDYSTIVSHYDMKSLGLAWKPFGLAHERVVSDIKDVLLKS